jgi:hypothetical protein
MIAARAAAACAVALVAASCGAPLIKLPTGAGVPATDGAEALAQATTACGRVRAISAEVAVSGSVGGHRLRGRLLVGLAEPASAYIEAPAPFGAPLFVFGASGGDATLLLPRDRRVLEHGRPADVLEAIAGVPLDPSDLRATLTGCATVGRDGPSGPAIAAKAFGDTWRLIPGDRQIYLHRDRPSEPWRVVSVDQPGADGWRADYRTFDADLPRSITLKSHAAKRFDLRLELSQVEINPVLEPSTFRVNIPAGTAPIPLADLRASGPLAR